MPVRLRTVLLQLCQVCARAYGCCVSVFHGYFFHPLPQEIEAGVELKATKKSMKTPMRKVCGNGWKNAERLYCACKSLSGEGMLA